mmetsp:Transcript_23997/g.76033  ORF Transcript_23997/g.76033 Transcript_23997/m.76033 type:complete len:214 (+) Transcript_23997:622-1263(+)
MRTRSASRRRLCRRAWCRSSRPRSPSSSRTTTCSTRCACSPPRSGEARTASASTARATCWSRASSTWRSWTATRSCGHRPSAASCEGRRCVARWSSLRSTSCRAASWRGSCRARSPLPTSSRRGRSFFSPATRTATPSSGWTASRSAMGGRARSTRRSSGSSSKTPPPGARTTSRCRRAAREIDLNSIASSIATGSYSPSGVYEIRKKREKVS